MVNGILGMVLALASAEDATKAHAAVDAVLDNWHKAAATADEKRYFSHFTVDAVMMGTDATERWTRDEFAAWAKPHFANGKGWNFKATKRNVAFSTDGRVAWFDEVLDTPNLGPARGSGVLVFDGKQWRIAQYNLSVPIPNEIFDDVKKQIEKHLKQPSKPSACSTAPACHLHFALGNRVDAPAPLG